MELRLTKDDIHELLENPSDEARAGIAAQVATQAVSQKLSDSERRIATDIIRIMACDAAVRVRSALADTLKHSEDIPHDIAMELARDVEVVAVPMLENSPVFSDDDLIDIMRDATGPKQLAIASRPEVSEVVSHALVEAGSNAVVAKLMSNDGANISDDTMNIVVDRFGDDELVNAPMATRDDLPVEIVERLVQLVSEEVRDTLLKSGKVSESLAEQLVEKTRERAMVTLARDLNRGQEVARLVKQLHENGRLKASVILRAVCTGEMRFFEEAMARLAKVNYPKAWVLIHDRGQLGLRALCTESGLPSNYFKPIRVAVDVYHELEHDGDADDRERFKQKMLERILTQFEELDDADLEFFLDKLAMPDTGINPDGTGSQQIAV